MFGNKPRRIYMVLFMLVGLLVGGFIGEKLGVFPYLKFLDINKIFGITTPLYLNLKAIQMTFSLTLDINIAGLIGMVLGLIIYRRL